MKLNNSSESRKNAIPQMMEAMSIILSTPAFIFRHKLWRGFFTHKWVMIFSILVAAAFSYTLYNNLHDLVLGPDPTTELVDIPTDGLDEGLAAIEEAQSMVPTDSDENLGKDLGKDLGKAKEELIEEKEKLEGDHKPIFSGSLKFLLLILLEVFIFHFAVNTNNILKSQNAITNAKGFVQAQIRMIKVMGRKWVYGLIMYVLVSLFCNLLGAEVLKTKIMFFVYSYFLGVAFLDNYLEQYHFTIRNSASRIRQHFGAATVLGVVASGLLHVPLIGPLVAPFLCAIAATRYGHHSVMEA